MIEVKNIWNLLTNEQKVILYKDIPSNMSELDFFDYGLLLLKKKTSFNHELLSKMIDCIDGYKYVERQNELINALVTNHNLLWDNNSFMKFKNKMHKNNFKLSEETINSIIENSDFSKLFNNQTILNSLLGKKEDFIDNPNYGSSTYSFLYLLAEDKNEFNLFESNVDLILKNSFRQIDNIDEINIKIDFINKSALLMHLKKIKYGNERKLTKNQLDILIRNTDLTFKNKTETPLAILILESNLELHEETFSFLINSLDLDSYNKESKTFLMLLLEKKIKLSESQLNIILEGSDLNKKNNSGDNFFNLILKSNNKLSIKQMDYVLKNTNLKELGSWGNSPLHVFLESEINLTEEQTDYIVKNSSMEFNQFSKTVLSQYLQSKKILKEEQVDYLIDNTKFDIKSFSRKDFKEILENCNGKLNFKQVIKLMDVLKKENEIKLNNLFSYALFGFNKNYDIKNINITSSQWLELFEKVEFSKSDNAKLLFLNIIKGEFSKNINDHRFLLAKKEDHSDTSCLLIGENNIPKILLGNIDLAITMCKLNRNNLNLVSPLLIKRLNLTKDNLEENLFIYEENNINKFKSLFKSKENKTMVQSEIYEEFLALENKSLSLDSINSLLETITINEDIKKSLNHSLNKINWFSKNEFKGIHNKDILILKNLVNNDLRKELINIQNKNSQKEIDFNHLNEIIIKTNKIIMEIEVSMVSFLNMELRKKTIVEEIKLDIAKHVNDLLQNNTKETLGYK